MIRQSVGAAQAGAAIMAFPRRKPEDGSPTNDPKVWKTLIPKVPRAMRRDHQISCSMGRRRKTESSAIDHSPR